MIGLLQRVSTASVRIDGQLAGEIGAGLLVLVGVVPADGQAQADRLLQRLLAYRVFADEQGRMNRSLRDTGGGLLLVPQFTLAADTHKGTRAGFSTAAEPARARELFAYLVRQGQAAWPHTAAGEFGAAMRVSLVNEGPVTFWLEA